MHIHTYTQMHAYTNIPQKHARTRSSTYTYMSTQIPLHYTLTCFDMDTGIDRDIDTIVTYTDTDTDTG